MNNKCIDLKQKLNHKLVCKRTNKEISLSQVGNVIIKNIKNAHNSLCKNTKKSAKTHNQSSNLRKLERNMFSLFTSDNDHCMICDTTYQLT